MAFLVSLVARNKNEIIGVSSMCAGSTYYFLLFKAVWVEGSPEEKVMKKI